MPDIIDNVKVGETIRKHMKKRGMTQDDLAKHLSVSKSAVSQNLRGKSSFDIQNLIAIAKLFDITLDDLLTQTEKTRSRPMSDLERLASEGIKAFEGPSVKDMRLSVPDVYGTFLVEYAMMREDVELVTHLDGLSIPLVETSDHRAPEVILSVIAFMLEHATGDVIRHVRLYAELTGSFVIPDDQARMRIWGLLDREENTSDLVEVLQYRPPFAQSLKAFSKRLKWAPLSRMDILSVTAEFRLAHVLKTFLGLDARNDDFPAVVSLFAGKGYEEGIDILTRTLFVKEPGWVDKTSIDVQKAFMTVIGTGNAGLVRLFAEKGLHTDLTAGVITLIRMEREDIASMVMAQFSKKVDFRRVGETLARHDNRPMIEEISDRLSQDDLDHMLSVATEDMTGMLLYLVRKGARFNETYYNLKTFDKVNRLIRLMLEGGKEHD
jgi:transcriptional regulator with XRE-family HTH domain